MKTILLIEDNDDMRENTTEILELDNYKGNCRTQWENWSRVGSKKQS